MIKTGNTPIQEVNPDIGPLFDDIFCIPHGRQYIIYMPLRGIIMSGNRALVNLLYRVRQGNSEAIARLGNRDMLNEMVESAQQASALMRPQRLQPFSPTGISLFLTDDCTLRCQYCYAGGGSSSARMPWEMVTAALDLVLENTLAARVPQMTVHFHGGGDLSAAWPLVIKTRSYLNRITQPHHIRVVTSAGLNGILDSSQCQWIIDNIDSATVSLDGPPDIQDFQRPRADGGPSFAAVNETLKTFDKHNFNYGLRCTVTQPYVHRLAEIVSFFCREYRVKNIKIEPMFPRGRALVSHLSSPDPVQFVRYFRKALKIAEKHGRTLYYSGARLETISNVFCRAAGNSAALTPAGWITSCYEVLNPNDPLSKTFFYGHYDTGRHEFVINQEAREKLFSLSVLDKPMCARCFCKWNCAGDCAAKSMQGNIGNIREAGEKLPYRCYINRELTKDQLIKALKLNKMPVQQVEVEGDSHHALPV